VSRKTFRGVALATALCVAAAVPATAIAKPVISMSGSTSVYPLAVQLATAYVKSCKHCVSFKILQGGSDVGISDVAHARVTIGDSSRDPIPGQDPSGLVFNKIARDAVCLITNRSNRVANLSQSQIQAIFSGRVRNWSQVPGAGTHGAIDLYTRTATSGTADAFLRIFMLPFSVSQLASQKASNGLVQQGVQSDPRGIGYVSLHFTGGTNPVAYNGTRCTLRNSKSGAYGGVRNFYMVTRGKATGATRKWIRWVQTSSTAARIVATGWVPLR
jgi:phosphate transport system substrate-binding protein